MRNYWLYGPETHVCFIFNYLSVPASCKPNKCHWSAKAFRQETIWLGHLDINDKTYFLLTAYSTITESCENTQHMVWSHLKSRVMNTRSTLKISPIMLASSINLGAHFLQRNKKKAFAGSFRPLQTPSSIKFVLWGRSKQNEMKWDFTHLTSSLSLSINYRTVSVCFWTPMQRWM